MVALHAVVEGTSERGFFERVFKPFWADRGVSLSCSLIRRGRHARGGAISYNHWHEDITRLLKEHKNQPSFAVTTMVDLYRLPKDFPGYEDCQELPASRVDCLEERWREDIRGRLRGQNLELPPDRFIPYIQRHELETLIFSDLSVLPSLYPDHRPQIERLSQETKTFQTPEDIDDGPVSSPSYRLHTAIPDYQKPHDPITLLSSIGIDQVCAKCPRFRNWIEKLEGLAAAGGTRSGCEKVKP